MSKTKPRIRWQLVTLAIGRFCLTTAARMLFPFLPEFARGLDVSVGQLQRATASRSIVGFAVPFLVPLSERFGRKLFLYIGLIVFSIGCLMAWQSSSLLPFAVAIVLLSLGQALYDPIMRTHIGDVVPWERRGRAVALTEISWSTALLIGAPLAGLLIARFAWNTPYLVLAIASLIAILLIWKLIPITEVYAGKSLDLGPTIRALQTNRALQGATLYVMALMFGNMLVFATYADRMEQRFGLTVGGLGQAAMVIGSADLIGELASGWLADRFGKRRVVQFATVAVAITYIIFPQTGGNRMFALVLLFLVFLSFEMAFISTIPIFTEVLPESRSVALAILSLAPPAARAVALLIAEPIILRGGFQLVGIVAAAVALFGGVAFQGWIQKLCVTISFV